MKNKLYLFAVFILLTLFSVNIPAQSPSKILKNATKALGGEKALDAVNSWKKSGLITRLKRRFGRRISRSGDRAELLQFAL